MDKEVLIDKVEEELKVSSDLGYDYRKIAENIIALIKGEREHIDYDHSKKMYEWEKT